MWQAERLIGRIFIAVSRASKYLKLVIQCEDLSLHNVDAEGMRLSELVGGLREYLRDGFLCSLVQHCDVEGLIPAARNVCRVDDGLLQDTVSSMTATKRSRAYLEYIAYDALTTTRLLLARIGKEFARRAAAMRLSVTG